MTNESFAVSVTYNVTAHLSVTGVICWNYTELYRTDQANMYLRFTHF